VAAAFDRRRDNRQGRAVLGFHLAEMTERNNLVGEEGGSVERLGRVEAFSHLGEGEVSNDLRDQLGDAEEGLLGRLFEGVLCIVRHSGVGVAGLGGGRQLTRSQGEGRVLVGFRFHGSQLRETLEGGVR